MEEALSYLRLILTEENSHKPIYLKPTIEANIIDQDSQAMKLDDYKKSIDFFAKRGLKKIKFVGGEPLEYRGLDQLIEYANKSGIEDIGITTNGLGLGTRVLDLKAKGLTNVNLSIDSLKEYRYQALMQGANLKEVFLSIDACRSADVKVKINCTAIKGFNDDELLDFMKLSISNDIDIRLVELLPYGIDPKVYERGYLDLREVIDNTEGILEEKGEEKSLGDYFRIYEAKGRIGIITKNHREYKEDLRRINISNRGYMNVGQLQKNEYFIKPLLDDKMAMNILFNKIKFGV